MKKILTLVLAFVIVTSIGSVIAFAVPEQQNQTYSFSELNPRSVSNLSDYSVRYDLITGETTVRRLDKTDLPLVADESDGFQGIQPFGYDDYWALVSNPAVRPYSRIC